jgi:hypothetical protein
MSLDRIWLDFYQTAALSHSATSPVSGFKRSSRNRQTYAGRLLANERNFENPKISQEPLNQMKSVAIQTAI